MGTVFGKPFSAAVGERATNEKQSETGDRATDEEERKMKKSDHTDDAPAGVAALPTDVQARWDALGDA